MKLDPNVEDNINNLAFQQCENIMVGDILHYELNIDVGILKVLKSLYCIVRDSSFSNYSFVINGIPDKIILFSNSYADRVDHFEGFNKVCSTTNDYIKVYAAKYKPARKLHTFLLVKMWMKNFRSLGINSRQAIYLTRILHQAYCDYIRVDDYITRKDLKIKSAVTVCDVMPIDSYFVQKWEKKGITTVTLQHGTFTLNQYPFTNSKSDYFLAQNLFSKNLAIKSGVDGHKIFVTGAPQSINVETAKKKQYNNTIGLVFSGLEGGKYDIELLSFARKYAEKYNSTIYVKLHPGFGEENYSQDIEKGVKKIFESEISAEEFADLVNIVIDDASTLFVEYSMQGRNVLTYLCEVSAYRNDKNIKLGFKNYEEMEYLLLLYKDENDEIKKLLKENKAYMGTINPPYENYKNFFESVLR